MKTNKIKQVVHIKQNIENISSYKLLEYTKYLPSFINEFTYYEKIESKINTSRSEICKKINSYTYYDFEFKDISNSVLSSLLHNDSFNLRYTIRVSPNGILSGNQYEYGDFTMYKKSYHSNKEGTLIKLSFLKNNALPMLSGQYPDTGINKKLVKSI